MSSGDVLLVAGSAVLVLRVPRHRLLSGRGPGSVAGYVRGAGASHVRRHGRSAWIAKRSNRLLDPAPDEIREALLQPVVSSRSTPLATRLVYGDVRRMDRCGRPGGVRGAPATSPQATVGIDEVDVVRFAAALMRIDVRDSVWIAIDDGRLPDDDLWRHLARVLPAPSAAPPLFLVGWAAWRRGHGALAAIAAERALEADPAYTAADLLMAALTNGVDPRSMPRVRRSGRKYDR